MSKKQIINELQRISNSIPEHLKKNIMEKSETYGTIKTIVNKALVDDDISPELKKKVQIIKASGLLDKKEEVENAQVTKKISDYLDEQIERSIRLGRLPERKQNINYLKKTKKYVKRNDKKINKD